MNSLFDNTAITNSVNEPFLNVVFTIDINYIQHFTATLISLVENNRTLNKVIWVIIDDVDIERLDSIKSFFETRYQISFKIIPIDSALFTNYIITEHISKATYYRLMLAKLLPEDVNKVLFLDSDVIVSGSLLRLAQLKTDDYYLLAAADPAQDNVDRLSKLGAPLTKYFNAGVMIINLRKWREDNVTDGLIQVATKFMEKLLYWDQDVLNIYFAEGYEELSSTYNAIFMSDRSNYGSYLNFIKNPPLITHFAGGIKPWHYRSSHPLKFDYWKYLKISPFNRYKYSDYTAVNFIKKVVFNKRY